MEEVWKDINLGPLQDDPPTPTPHTISSSKPPNFILQDFLASTTRPFSKKAPQRSDNHINGTDSSFTLFGSPLPVPTTTIVPNLNSGPPGFDHFLGDNCNPGLVRTESDLHGNPIPNVSGFDRTPFDEVLGISNPFGNKKRGVPQESDGGDSNTGDRRHKRMIKNRESAARSRARKQAYTNELEMEVAHLMEENARLRKQEEKLRIAAAALPAPKRHTLIRTLTAPF